MNEHVHPIQGLMKTTMENLRQMVDANTIIGKAVESADGSVIVPVSKVSFGFAAGGSDFQTTDMELRHLFGGGSGGGVSITPVAFLVVNQQGIRSVPLENSAHLFDRILDTAPQFLDKLQQRKPQKATVT